MTDAIHKPSVFVGWQQTPEICSAGAIMSRVYEWTSNQIRV